MAYIPFYSRWKNKTEGSTPVTAEALNKIDDALLDAHQRLDRIDGQQVGSLPAGLGWTLSSVPISPSTYDLTMPVGAAGILATALFDTFSTARTAPAQTYWVAPSGVDTNAGTEAAPFRTLSKAVSAANTAGTPTRVNVLGGIYERSRSFYFTATAPTVDLAVVATGGRVITGTFDLFNWSTPDATFASCYSGAVANCDRVVDTKNLNRFGNYSELVKVATADQCNRTPNSWALVSGTLYIHRGDEQAVTASNTKVFRDQPFTFLVETPLNVYVEGFDLEGASGSGVARVDMKTAGTTSTTKVAVFANCTFKYGGGAVGTGTVGLAASSWNGITAAFNCQADANATDGFNYHNAQGVSNPFSLTVNCSARDNGRGSSQSCNGLTYHENCIGVDITGLWEENRGGTVRNINSSKLYMFGSVVRNDKGDLGVGGSMPPTGIRIDDSSELWCERVRVEMPRGQAAYATGSGTAKIHRRNCTPTPQPDFGPGTFDTF